MIVARIDRHHHRQRVVGGDERRGVGGKRGQADRRFAGGERDAARGGDADAQAGEAAGSGGDRDAVERGEVEPGALDHARDQRDQRFGVAAHHRQRFMRGDRAALGVEHGGRAGLERGIDGKDAHERGNSSTVSARRRQRSAYTGRTSMTSGTKCLSRFWMPCWSVAVEDGQPEQAPFMVR